MLGGEPLKYKSSKENHILVNENITFPCVRVIDANGKQLGILDIRKAVDHAKNQGVDLVLVNENSNPPVCKLIDYGKHKFIIEKRVKENRKKQASVLVKEVKMTYKINEHDYETRLHQAFRFLKSGNKVKVTLTFKGREIQHLGLGTALLSRFITDLKQIAEVKRSPYQDGKMMILILSPKNLDSCQQI
nr:translation initiation factor 3 [Cyanidiaceae sp.]